MAAKVGAGGCGVADEGVGDEVEGEGGVVNDSGGDDCGG